MASTQSARIRRPPRRGTCPGRRFRRSPEPDLMNEGRAYTALTCNAGPGHTGTGHRSGSRYGRGGGPPGAAVPHVPGRVPAQTRVPAARSLPCPGNPDMRSATGRRRASGKSAKRRLRARLTTDSSHARQSRCPPPGSPAWPPAGRFMRSFTLIRSGCAWERRYRWARYARHRRSSSQPPASERRNRRSGAVSRLAVVPAGDLVRQSRKDRRRGRRGCAESGRSRAWLCP